MTQYWLFALRAQQFWEESRDSSGWKSAGTRFHLSQRDDVQVSVLSQCRVVRARCGSAESPQDRPSGGVRGYNRNWAIGLQLHRGITMKKKCIAFNVLWVIYNTTEGNLYTLTSNKCQTTMRIIQDVFCSLPLAIQELTEVILSWLELGLSSYTPRHLITVSKELPTSPHIFPLPWVSATLDSLLVIYLYLQELGHIVVAILFYHPFIVTLRFLESGAEAVDAVTWHQWVCRFSSCLPSFRCTVFRMEDTWLNCIKFSFVNLIHIPALPPSLS